MTKDPKVVSFERTPAYLHHRAMLNRRENNTIDALELMRHAVERSPENREYRLDLAELLYEMGCHEQSNKLLLDLLAEDDGPSECYYGLALNQLGMSDVSGAMKSLKLYQKRDPNGPLLGEVARLAAELTLYESMNRPVSRRLYRATRIADRACEAMREDMPEKACRLFEKTLELASEQYEMRALYAMSLCMVGKVGEAKRNADLAAKGFPPSVRALCVCAQVYGILGEDELAFEMIRRIEDEHPYETERRLFIYTLGEMGLDERAADCARLALQETPYDRELLHVRAIAMKRAGADDRAVAGFWTRILRIDPDDSIARFYEETAHAGKLDQYRLEYAYQVPDEEYERRIMYLVANINRGYDHVRQAWLDDEVFRSLVTWCIDSQDKKLEKAAMTVLATMDSHGAGSAIREIMFNADVAPETKMHGAMLLRLRGADMRKYLPPDADPADGMLPDAEGMLSCIQVGERQLIRFTHEVLEREYGISALSALTLMWMAYRRTRNMRTDPLIRIEGASAALAYNYLLMHGVHPDPRKLTKDFNCTMRQMVYYARRIAACLDKNKGE